MVDHIQENDREFQKRAQRIGGLVQEIESIADPAVRKNTRELVQLLMDLHGAGLERILEIAFQSGEAGARIIDELGHDPLVSSLLVLYGIHPDDVQTRVEEKLEQIRPRLRKMGAEVTLASANGGDIRLGANVDGQTCGSTARTVRAMLEEAMYEAAPDLTSLVVEGLEEPANAGFVGVEKLFHSTPLNSAVAPAVSLESPLGGTASEGMD